MSILMSDDTRRVIKAGASKCNARSLLQSRFVFRDDTLDESKRLALYLITSQGSQSLAGFRNDQQEEIYKAEHKLSQQERREGDHAKARARIAAAQAVLSRIQHLTGWSGGHVPASTAWLDAIPAERKRLVKLTTASRLIIGMATGVLENAGLTLHRFFGIPCIPGSASKAVARDACAASPEHAPQLLKVFGNEQAEKKVFQQGKVCFLPAYPTSNDPRIELDILTPHFAKYYTATGNPNAEDTEGPNPQVFPAVAAGEEFVFPLVVMNARLSDDECQALIDTAELCLTLGLTTSGIGAKTAAGYGLFSSPKTGVAPARDALFPLPKIEPADAFVTKWQGKLNSFNIGKGFLDELAALCKGDVALETDVVGRIVPPTTRASFANLVTNPKGFDLLKRLNLLPPRKP